VAITSLAAELDPPADAPVLVLGNSMGTTASVWEPQLAQLRRHFRLLRYEHPGHGRGRHRVDRGAGGQPLVHTGVRGTVP
jgi:pimeloyl-ACP methyl ester carboxylesterase